MARTRRPLHQLTDPRGTKGTWVQVRLQTKVEWTEQTAGAPHARAEFLEVVRWLPEHLDLRLGITLILPDSPHVSWLVLEIGTPYHHGKPVGDYVGQRWQRDPVMPAADPLLAPAAHPPIATSSAAVRDQQQRRVDTRQARQLDPPAPIAWMPPEEEPEHRIAWRRNVAAGLQRRRAAGLPIGRQVQQRKRAEAAAVVARAMPTPPDPSNSVV